MASVVRRLIYGEKSTLRLKYSNDSKLQKILKLPIICPCW